MPTLNREEKMDWWLEKGLNVLFRGKHGVGKTALVKAAFNRANLKWRYFSASTMDPWVDFVGVPREKREKVRVPILGADGEPVMKEKMENGVAVIGPDGQPVMEPKMKIKRVSYLQLIRPRDFADGTVEALFFDEFNRAPKKVRNAVMELLQFKSINGEKFPNLKCVWAAINPDDDEDNEYDVEKLDPAQADRFHAIVDIPYKPHGPYFQAMYGEKTARAAIEWWEALDEPTKKLVSPRRLDYAMLVHQEHGDMRDVLPIDCNVSKLTSSLAAGPVNERLEELMRGKRHSDAKTFLANDNYYTQSMRLIPESETMMEFFLPLLPTEKLQSLIAQEDRCFRFITTKIHQVPLFKKVCDEALRAGANQRLCKKLRRALQETEHLAEAYQNEAATGQAIEPFFNQTKASADYHTKIGELKLKKCDSPHDRMKIFMEVQDTIPAQMSADDALATLTLFENMASQWLGSLASTQQHRFVGIVNQCFSQINRCTGEDFATICQKYGGSFQNLLKKIKDAGLGSKLATDYKTKIGAK